MSKRPAEIDVVTPPGRGAVAVIACTGDIAVLDGSASAAALCVARDGRPFAGRAINRITFARWGNEHLEDVVVCRTGEGTFEVHCHGGSAAIERIRGDLAPSELQDPSSRREASNRKSDSELIAAAWDAVSRATTLRTADLLLHQAAVAWPRLLESLPRECEAPAEPHSTRDSPSQRAPDRLADPGDPLHWTRFGLHLTTPWVVALVGLPNAGKSSLMNALAGFQRSIVNPTPGTTRDAVTLDVAFDGWPVRLVDTAGLRDSADELESAGIERARRVMDEADLVLQVFDVTEQWPVVMAGAIPVANKIDLLSGPVDDSAGVVSVSALAGIGLEGLVERIVTRLVPSTPPAGLAVPVSTSHLLFLKSLTTK